MNLEQAKTLTAPFVCQEGDRKSIALHCALEWDGVGYVVGTNGHVLVAVACEQWQEAANPDQPNLHQLVTNATRDIKECGMVNGEEVVKALGLLKASVSCSITYSTETAPGMAQVEVYLPKRENSKGKITRPRFSMARFLAEWGGCVHPRVSVSFDARLLGPCAAAVSASNCSMHLGPGSMDPALLVPEECVLRLGDKPRRFAVVMPMRL